MTRIARCHCGQVTIACEGERGPGFWSIRIAERELGDALDAIPRLEAV